MENVISIGPIDKANGISCEQFKQELSACDPSEPVYLDIHSDGGDVFEGFGIGQAIKDWTGKTIARVKTAAFSIASYIAMTCDEIEIASNGFFMVHNPWTNTSGDAKQHQKNHKVLTDLQSEMLRTYSSRTGIPENNVAELMAEETFINAADAVATGWADRVLESIVPDQKLPKANMPQTVYAAMFAAPVVPPAETPKEKPVTTNSQPVAASVRDIKAAFPKASSDFVVMCAEKEMPLEDVGEEYAKAMETENEELKAKVAEMEEELTALKAAAATEEETPVAMEEEEEKQPVAQARRTGTQPVNTPAAPVTKDPTAEWNALVESFKAKGKNAAQAVIAANKANPALRQAFVASQS